MRILPDEERLQMVAALEANKKEVMQQISVLPRCCRLKGREGEEEGEGGAEGEVVRAHACMRVWLALSTLSLSFITDVVCGRACHCEWRP